MKSRADDFAPKAAADEVGALLMTPREAARMLRVSAEFLRASSCPKILMRSNGRTPKAVVRYQHAEVVKWIIAQSVKANHPQHRRT